MHTQRGGRERERETIQELSLYLGGAKKGHVFTEVGQARNSVRITQIA